MDEPDTPLAIRVPPPGIAATHPDSSHRVPRALITQYRCDYCRFKGTFEGTMQLLWQELLHIAVAAEPTAECPQHTLIAITPNFQ